ncbi:hypothetical protein ORV05_00550 [Amycolatopsis cynarae]|uniref:Uncharacterized protein n=1 Tax=Amycolatopsis cynarae TaxID=2995223 RepID=A0ABY7B217_9PSEU|nr:hypothetical protein [Amycolatopsis sp. HUAS 11-8]WAL66345.1 hypothetical protein ORV05_00550 [Amycolatopsis sp. HUAS 11-8]
MNVTSQRVWERFLDHLERREIRRSRMLPGWRTRRHRRTLTTVLIAASLVMIADAALMGPAPNPWFFTFWFASYLAWLASFVLLRVLTGKMCSSFSALLDERERELRHRVSYFGYQALATLMVLGLGYLLAISHLENAALRGAMMLAALLMLGGSVPAIILGWTLPDDDPEDRVA